jgi:hypothetical protein
MTRVITQLWGMEHPRLGPYLSSPIVTTLIKLFNENEGIQQHQPWRIISNIVGSCFHSNLMVEEN